MTTFSFLGELFLKQLTITDTSYAVKILNESRLVILCCVFFFQEEELAQQGLLFQSYGLSLSTGTAAEMDATPVFADLPPGLGFYDIRRRFVDRAKRIDTISRALFPMSFLMFNVLYWLTYKVLRHEDLLAAL